MYYKNAHFQTRITVDSPTLALIAPLLGKALRGRSSALKRKAARVIDNMCRLVKEPADVAPFMPLLLPALDKVIDEIVDAEVRSKDHHYMQPQI